MVEVSLNEAHGVWTNHIRDGQIGNNLKTIKLDSQMSTEMFLLARHDIATKTELSYDY